MEDPEVANSENIGGVTLICPLVVIDARLEHKYNSLKKHADIARTLKREILILESEKSFAYSQLMKRGFNY